MVLEERVRSLVDGAKAERTAVSVSARGQVTEPASRWQRSRRSEPPCNPPQNPASAPIGQRSCAVGVGMFVKTYTSAPSCCHQAQRRPCARALGPFESDERQRQLP
jgi:hypothetical protein